MIKTIFLITSSLSAVTQALSIGTISREPRCIDTDCCTTDSFGDGCEELSNYGSTSLADLCTIDYDTDTYKVNDMCCLCGGGLKVDADDERTKTDICPVCDD